jgi:hypothetical protein
MPNFFEVIPVMVYRIYPDGREELVRGVDLIGTALTAFNKIVAADNRFEAFNGMCGAESGPVPVAVGGPGLLFSEIEVQKKPKVAGTLAHSRAAIRRQEVRTGATSMTPKVLSAAVFCAVAVWAADDPVMLAMRDELARSMKKLQLENLQKPYFISYRAVETAACSAQASFGALTSVFCEPPAAGQARSRNLGVEVRVGDYSRDNTSFFAPQLATAGVTARVLRRRGERAHRRQLRRDPPPALAGNRQRLQERAGSVRQEEGRARKPHAARATRPISARSRYLR